MAEVIELADAHISTTFDMRGIDAGFKAIEKGFAGVDKLLAGLGGGLKDISSISQQLAGPLSMFGGKLGDILGGFAAGGAAGAGLAAVNTLLPMVIDGVVTMVDAWKHSDEALKQHKEYVTGMTQAYRLMIEAVKDAKTEVGQADRALAEVMNPRKGREDRQEMQDVERNRGRGFGLEEAERNRLDKADLELAQAEIKQRDAVKRMRERAEPADDIFNAERKLEAINQGRQRIEERRDEGDKFGMQVQDMMAQEKQASREDDQRARDLVERDRLRIDAEAWDINERIRTNNSEQGHLGNDFRNKGVAGERSRTGGIEDLHNLIQAGANDPEAIKRQQEAAAQLEATKKISEDTVREAKATQRALQGLGTLA